ncbi:MAG: hypothetical protein RI897_2134 [Verrucomicrobiota bacterium]
MISPGLFCLITPTLSTPNRLTHERQQLSQGNHRIAGVDEAGRGPLAGPVIAAAVILPLPWIQHGPPESLARLNDSKQLSAKNRERLFETLTQSPAVQIGTCQIDAPEIDQINILKATHLAMNRALQQLSPPPDHTLIDGLPVSSLRFPQTAIVKGDSLSLSIAAASIIAKVTRDRLMLLYDTQYPGYGFAQHKGYGTATHLAAIQQLGPCPIHRLSFAPLKPPTQKELF